MLSIFARLSSRLLAVREREGTAAHMQGTVFTLARLKIVPTINLYHIQCLYFDCEYLSLNKTLAPFP